MAIEITTPRTPGWYLDRLQKKLIGRVEATAPLFAAYDNNGPLPDSLRDAPDAAKAFYKAARTGWAEMIVKAVKYPLRIQGVLTDADRDAGDIGDAVAYQMMRRSGMLAEADDVVRLALISGNGYAMVGKDSDGPCYTSEDPRQVVTIHDPLRQSRILAAAKFYYDDELRQQRAILHLPGEYWVAVPPEGAGKNARFSDMWSWEKEATPSGLRVVPIFRYRNEEGVGEFERHLDIIGRLQHMTLQGMMIATLQAFRQRALKVPVEDMPDEDEHGREIDYNDVLSGDPGAFWKLPETAEIWESGGVDLTPVWTGLEKFIQQLSAVTFTPLAMFSPEGQNQSAAGAGFAREGRTFKIEDRQDRFGDVHARALAALFELAGDEARSDHWTLEIVWRPAERYSLSEKADALTKYRAGGVPWRTAMIDVAQYTPKQVARMESERLADEVLFGADAAMSGSERITPQEAAPAAAIRAEASSA